MPGKIFDVIVIGAGSGGLTTAVGLSKLGKKVLLIEREHMGGECTNSGCIPSKALLHHAKQYRQAIKIAGRSFDSETFKKQTFPYIQKVVNGILSEETPEHFQEMGIEVIVGEASFLSKDSISVNEETYYFKKAIISTGSSPRLLSIPGLSEELILTNQNIFQLSEVPSKTLIIGGGPIGMEVGQAFSMLGSDVTIVENGTQFARLEDKAISPIITNVFKKQGIKIFTDANVKRVSGNMAEIEVGEVDSEAVHLEHIFFDKILIAVGRVPNLPIGLKLAEIGFSDSGITVNSNWQTTNKNIYALGDVSARLKFTHVADDIARQVVTYIASKGIWPVRNKAVPKVTYTSPEIAQIGLSHFEAIEEHGEENIMRIEIPFSQNDRAKTDEATDGMLVVIAKRLTGKILGAHIINKRAGELIGTFSLAMEQNISLYKLRSTIFAYPTYSLVIKKAGDFFLSQQIKTLKPDLFRHVKKHAPKIIVVALWIWGLMTLFSYQQTFGLTPTELSLKIFKTITSTPWAPLLYILAYTIRPVTFFPGTALTILSGIFFGLWGGIVYTIIGASFSATLAYFVGHFFSKAATNGKKLLSGWTNYLHQNPFMAILMMRLTFFPFDLVAYGAGFLRVKFFSFLSATMLGTLLGITTFVAIGASISIEEFARNGITTDAINLKFIVISITIFTASHLVAEIVKRKKKI